MVIGRWDPFQNIETLQDRINRLFDDSFPGIRGRSSDDSAKGDWKPPADIYETGNTVVIAIELPGTSKADISIEVKADLLAISGEKREENTIAEENYYRKERQYGGFNRSFTLQDPVDPSSIKASFKEGVLTIVIPKPEPDKPKQITVNIE